MSTSPTTFRRRVRRGALGLAVSAICLPSGSALAQGDTKADYPGTHRTAPVHVVANTGDTPADYPGTSGAVAPRSGDTPADYPGTSGTIASKSGDTPADYPGMPGSPQTPEPASHTQVAGGFDWTSAAVGAGGAGLLIVVALGGAATASRLRMRAVRP
jgi:hypothetical protein